MQSACTSRHNKSVTEYDPDAATGKSTLFNALTKATISAENYPFYTIDPNIGVVPLPDARLDRLAEIVKPERVRFNV